MQAMKLSFDPAKRELTLMRRGLDFADAGRIFDGDTLDFIDDRIDYGEKRIVSIGQLDDLTVVVVWTLREHDRRVISMRKASRDERETYYGRMGRS